MPFFFFPFDCVICRGALFARSFRSLRVAVPPSSFSPGCFLDGRTGRTSFLCLCVCVCAYFLLFLFLGRWWFYCCSCVVRRASCVVRCLVGQVTGYPVVSLWVSAADDLPNLDVFAYLQAVRPRQEVYGTRCMAPAQNSECARAMVSSSARLPFRSRIRKFGYFTFL